MPTILHEPMKQKCCTLQYAAGRIEECPRSECPFWEEGGAVLEGACAIDRLGLVYELQHNNQLAHWLLRVRTRLAHASEPEHGWRLFHQLLPPGLRD